MVECCPQTRIWRKKLKINGTYGFRLECRFSKSNRFLAPKRISHVNFCDFALAQTRESADYQLLFRYCSWLDNNRLFQLFFLNEKFWLFRVHVWQTSCKSWVFPRLRWSTETKIISRLTDGDNETTWISMKKTVRRS